MAQLKIAEGLTLPIEAVTEKLAFLGRTGQGKTYAAQRLAEEMHRAGAQFVALDPVGKWWSLRLAADGKSPGIPVPVFGGLHGDIPLEYTAGRLIADLVADRGISVVLDVSQFEHDTHRNRFARDFGERLFFRRKTTPSAVHLFLEEAQEFVPQNLSGEGDREVLRIFTRIWKLGRNFGIGGSLITQRPQEVNKKVINLTELLFAFQLTGSHERKAVEQWIKDKDIKGQDIEAMLPKLESSRPHVWSPAWLKVSKVVQIKEKWTFDASATPKVGARAVEVQPLAPIDLEKIKKEMAATIEKAKAEDPRELRKQIATLKADLAKASKGAMIVTAPAETKVEIKEIPVLKPDELHRLEEAISGAMDAQSAAREVSLALGQIVTGMGQLLDNARQIAARASLAVAPSRTTARTQPAHPAPRPASARPRATTRGTLDRGERSGDLNRGERTILTAIAQYPDGVSSETLTVLTGYKRSSRDTYLQRLRQAGLIEGSSDRWDATTEGVGQLADDFEPLPTGDALREHWLNRLGGGERALLEVLVKAYPRPVDNERLSEQTGYARSSRDTYLQKLRARRLIVSGRGESRASEELFG